MSMQEIIFIVTEDESGGYNARAIGHGIFTQAETREELEQMVRDAVRCHFEPEQAVPKLIHLHYVHDEVIAL
jgi:predicted RNase H-like HicB family nuclease